MRYKPFKKISLGIVFILTFLIILNFGIKTVSAEEATSLTSKLISYWPFEEGGGDATADMNLARVIHLINGNWTDGKVGKAIRFSGNGENSEGISPYIKLGPKFSVSFWLKINNIGGNYDGYTLGPTPLILENYAGGIYNIFLIDWIRKGTQSGYLFPIYRKQSYDHQTIVWQSSPVGTIITATEKKSDFHTDTSWHHIVTVFDIPNNDSKIYVDGVLASNGASAYGNTSLNNLTFEMILGWVPYYNGDYILDELAIYNGILSDREIQDLYQKGLNNEHLSEIKSNKPLHYSVGFNKKKWGWGGWWWILDPLEITIGAGERIAFNVNGSANYFELVNYNDINARIKYFDSFSGTGYLLEKNKTQRLGNTKSSIYVTYRGNDEGGGGAEFEFSHTCSPECLPEDLGDGVCQEGCNVEACNYDESDCGGGEQEPITEENYVDSCSCYNENVPCTVCKKAGYDVGGNVYNAWWGWIGCGWFNEEPDWCIEGIDPGDIGCGDYDEGGAPYEITEPTVIENCNRKWTITNISEEKGVIKWAYCYYSREYEYPETGTCQAGPESEIKCGEDKDLDDYFDVKINPDDYPEPLKSELRRICRQDCYDEIGPKEGSMPEKIFGDDVCNIGCCKKPEGNVWKLSWAATQDECDGTFMNNTEGINLCFKAEREGSFTSELGAVFGFAGLTRKEYMCSDSNLGKYSACGTCINPEAEEVCDGVNNNCDSCGLDRVSEGVMDCTTCSSTYDPAECIPIEVDNLITGAAAAKCEICKDVCKDKDINLGIRTRMKHGYEIPEAYFPKTPNDDRNFLELFNSIPPQKKKRMGDNIIELKNVKLKYIKQNNCFTPQFEWSATGHYFDSDAIKYAHRENYQLLVLALKKLQKISPDIIKGVTLESICTVVPCAAQWASEPDIGSEDNPKPLPEYITGVRKKDWRDSHIYLLKMPYNGKDKAEVEVQTDALTKTITLKIFGRKIKLGREQLSYGELIKALDVFSDFSLDRNRLNMRFRNILRMDSLRDHHDGFIYDTKMEKPYERLLVYEFIHVLWHIHYTVYDYRYTRMMDGFNAKKWNEMKNSELMCKEQ